MYDEPLDIDPNSIKQMRMMMIVALRLILDEKSLDEFLSWAKTSIPVLAPLMLEDYTAEEQPRMAYWIGVGLWNSAPQPGNHFKPQAIAKPSRNSACPCGSGLKYKQCCSRLPTIESLPTDVFWTLMHEVMPKKQINLHIKNHQLPINAIAIIADQFSVAGDDVQVIKMLEPLFDGEASRLNHKHSGLLDTLCDSYNAHYKTDKKKKDLLQRMCEHKDRSIRAEAWQRVSSWQLDLGDFPAAMDALSKAMQAEPENPSHSLLELSLLVSSKQIEQAKQRAGFWRRKLKHLEFELPELINTLEHAQTDPAGALQLTMSQADDDPRLLQLLEWIDDNADLPIAEYTFEEMSPELDEDELEENDAHLNPMLNAICILPPKPISDIEQQWQAIKPIDKPFGTQHDPMGGDDIWYDTHTAPYDKDWINFLQQTPQAINSLDIMDDLATLIYIHPNGDSIWGPLGKMQPLLDRSLAIIEQLKMPDTLNQPYTMPYTMPWVMPENRPALRLLVHNINIAINQDEHQQSIRLIKHYLRLNPQDNHGYRSLLINHYLQHNDNHNAIALAANYPDDMLAETGYGSVLAHYRLGDLEAAEQALQQSLEHLPLIAQYLIKARVAQPELSDFGIRYGGEDQAWFYRDEMRDTWVQAKGSLGWLKKQLDEIKQ